MKKIVYFGIIVLVVCLSACQKEYNPFDEETPPSFTGDFRAKINGNPWVADKVAAAHREAGVIVITGLSLDKKSILLRVADSGVHNYSFHSESISNAAAFSDSALTNVAAFTTNQYDSAGIYGNLNITSIDTTNKKMSGTFSFKAYRMLDSSLRTITEGVFNNITYTTQSQLLNPTDTFRVKTDGNPFSYNLLLGYKSFGRISITASMSSGAPSVGVTVPDNVTPGTYAFDLLSYVGQYNLSMTTYLASDTGTVTILEHNTSTKRIRGNFNFLANTPFTHAPPNHQLTEGYFSVKYN